MLIQRLLFSRFMRSDHLSKHVKTHAANEKKDGDKDSGDEKKDNS